MFSNRLALVAIGAGCIAAAGVGGYIAQRQTTTPASVAAQAPQGAPAAASSRPVQETEAVVAETAKRAPTVEEKAAKAPAASARAAEPKAAKAVKPAEPKPAEAKRAEAQPIVPMAPRSMQARQAAPMPTLDGPWPSAKTASAPPPPPLPGTPAPVDEPSLPAEPPHASVPPPATFQELVVSADSVIGLQIQGTISSERARVEDPVEARVTRDVRVGGRVAIPAGARALGSVTLVERGGKFKERARLGVRFHTIVLGDGTHVPVSTDTLYREGDAPQSAAKVGGGAVGGAILGAILGGARGAMIGATAGGAAGAGVVAAGDRNAATLQAGSPVTVRLLSPVTVTVDK